MGSQNLSVDNNGVILQRINLLALEWKKMSNVFTVFLTMFYLSLLERRESRKGHIPILSLARSMK